MQLRNVSSSFIWRSESFCGIVIYEPSAENMSALFEARATKERVLNLHECAEYVFTHRSLYNIF
jgi:hypothetical protein